LPKIYAFIYLADSSIVKLYKLSHMHWCTVHFLAQFCRQMKVVVFFKTWWFSMLITLLLYFLAHYIVFLWMKLNQSLKFCSFVLFLSEWLMVNLCSSALCWSRWVIECFVGQFAGHQQWSKGSRPYDWSTTSCRGAVIQRGPTWGSRHSKHWAPVVHEGLPQYHERAFICEVGHGIVGQRSNVQDLWLGGWWVESAHQSVPLLWHFEIRSRAVS